MGETERQGELMGAETKEAGGPPLRLLPSSHPLHSATTRAHGRYSRAGNGGLRTCIMRSSWLLLSTTVPSRPTTGAGGPGLGLLLVEPARLLPVDLLGEALRELRAEHPKSVSST